MGVWILRLVLYAVLLFSIFAFALLIRSWRTMDQKEAMNQLLNFVPAIGSIVVGFVTVEVLHRQSSYQYLEHQPTFVVDYIFNDGSVGDSLPTNEEYIITNVGERTKTSANVDVTSFLKLTITDSLSRHPVEKYCKIDYFAPGVMTNQLTGKIFYSVFSGENITAYQRVIEQTVEMERAHPGVFVDVDRIDVFCIHYQDMYGADKTVYRGFLSEYDDDYLKELTKKSARLNGNGSISIYDVQLSSLLSL